MSRLTTLRISEAIYPAKRSTAANLQNYKPCNA